MLQLSSVSTRTILKIPKLEVYDNEKYDIVELYRNLFA